MIASRDRTRDPSAPAIRRCARKNAFGHSDRKTLFGRAIYIFFSDRAEQRRAALGEPREGCQGRHSTIANNAATRARTGARSLACARTRERPRRRGGGGTARAAARRRRRGGVSGGVAARRGGRAWRRPSRSARGAPAASLAGVLESARGAVPEHGGSRGGLCVRGVGWVLCPAPHALCTPQLTSCRKE
jgi:hypothetical protein